MNKSLAITANIIPYSKDIRKLTGSVTSAILMQQLEYWFSKNKNGFYKFLEPAGKNQLYRDGDSWTEELGFSKDEFRSAFSKIGIRYKSKKEYFESDDRFKDKFYCSYHDKRKGITYYFRNHNYVDNEIESLCKSENPTSVNRKTRSIEVGKPDLEDTETTTETTKKDKENQAMKSPVTELDKQIKSIQEFWHETTKKPCPNNASTRNNIKATINQYSFEQLKSAIVGISKDEWSIEKNLVSINRLTKSDKRFDNMERFVKKKENVRTKPVEITEKMYEKFAQDKTPDELQKYMTDNNYVYTERKFNGYVEGL